MHFPHLGRPPCRSGNSHPAKNTSPPFYVRSAVFLTPSIKPAPPFYAFPASRKTSLSVGKFPTRKEYFAAVLRPLSRFSHSVDKTRSAVLRILRLKELPKKEKRRGISATDTPLSPTPRSLQRGLYPTRLDSTRIYHQSQRLFINKIPPRQNPRFIDVILYLLHQSQYLTLPLAIFFKYSPYLLLPYCLIISFNCAFVIHLLL